MNLQILEKVAENKLSPVDAYILEAKREGKLRRARFIRWKMKIDEMPIFLRGVFHTFSVFPIPLVFAKPFMKRLPAQALDVMDAQTMLKLLRYAKGTVIDIESDGVKIQFKI